MQNQTKNHDFYEKFKKSQITRITYLGKVKNGGGYGQEPAGGGGMKASMHTLLLSPLSLCSMCACTVPCPATRSSWCFLHGYYYSYVMDLDGGHFFGGKRTSDLNDPCITVRLTSSARERLSLEPRSWKVLPQGAPIRASTLNVFLPPTFHILHSTSC